MGPEKPWPPVCPVWHPTRRCRLDMLSPTELAIVEAMRLVEGMGADVRLTSAVVLLQQARDKVADYIDERP